MSAPLPYLPVVIGLVAGTLGRYGLVLEDGQAIQPRRVLGHCMMLMLLGLLAEAATSIVPTPPMAHAIAGAGAALLAAKLVRRFIQRADDEAARQLGVQDRKAQP